MDEALICNDYSTAKNKNKQIQILAELNDCKPSAITEILARHGLISGLPQASKKRAKSVDWSVMDAEVSRLAKDGLKITEIAERLGISTQSIYARRSYLSGNKKSKIGTKHPEKVMTNVSTNVITFDSNKVKSNKELPTAKVLMRILSSYGIDVKTAVADLMTDSICISGEGHGVKIDIGITKTAEATASSGQTEK